MTTPVRGEGAFLRKMAHWGATEGPEALLRLAPPLIGALFWAAVPARREGVVANLRRIKGPRGQLVEQLDAARTFVAFARSLAEGYAALGPRARDVLLDIEGREHFKVAETTGQGVILLTAHTSSYEVAGAALSRHTSREFVVVMRPEPNAAGREVADQIRRSAGISVVHVGDDPLSALELARKVREGALVSVQLDRAPQGQKAVETTLFGEPFLVPLGPFALARATGAAILPVLTRRTGFLRARVRAHPPIRLGRRASRDDIQAAVDQVARLLEAWVKQAPHEWLDWGGR